MVEYEPYAPYAYHIRTQRGEMETYLGGDNRQAHFHQYGRTLENGGHVKVGTKKIAQLLETNDSRNWDIMQSAIDQLAKYHRHLKNYDELRNACYWVRNQFPKSHKAWILEDRPAGETWLGGDNLLRPGNEKAETRRKDYLKKLKGNYNSWY